MRGCCKTCECYRELENGNCRQCNHQPKVKVVVALKDKPRKKTGELELFKLLHIERGNKCELCGKVIYGFSPSNYHHLKPKGLFPKLRLDPTNILKVCVICHNKQHGH